MGDQENPADWLPVGWRTEVKAKQDGKKKGEVYISPSGDVEFQSKLEVLQYVKDNKDTLDKEDDGKPKFFESAHTKKMVVFEKAIPSGLPPGWIKEIKITKKGNKIRRDAFYTDPVTGYVFRSMKDTLRYIDTGDLGRLAFKPKDKEEMNAEVEEDDTSTPAATKKQKLEDDEASSLTVDEPRLNSSGSEKDELMHDSASLRESIAVLDHTRDQCELGAGTSSSDMAVADCVSPSNLESDSSKSECLEVPDVLASKGTSTVDNSVNQSNGKSDSMQSGSLVLPAGSGPQFSISDSPINNKKDQLNAIDSSSGEFSVTPATEVPSGEQPKENGVGDDESKSPAPSRSKKKKDLSTPRRASKRLAGMQVDPALELKTKSRTRRVVAVDPAPGHEIAQTVAEDTSSHQTDALQEVMGTSDDKHPETPAAKHSEGNIGASNQPAEKGEVVRQRDENQDFATAPPVAVQANTEDHPEIVGGDIYIDQKLELPLDLSLGDLWQDPCIAFAIQTLTGSSFDNCDGFKMTQGELKYSATSDSAVPEHPSEVAEILSKANNEAASPQSVPPVDVWSDPCIEFAIKTLTDAIPLDYGLVIQDFLPQQSTSSQSQPSSGEFCQTKFSCQPFGAPIFNQPGYVEPANAMPLPSTTSMRYPGGASHQRSDERSKKRVS